MPSTCTASNATGPAEGEGGEDRELVGGIDAVDVEGRVGLRVAEPLRLGEHVGELAAALLHHGQDVVAGAVEDAGDRGSMRLPASPSRSALMTGMPPATAASKPSGTPRRLGLRRQFGAVHREQRLVRRHHRLAGRDRRFDQDARRARPLPPISSTTTSTAVIGRERDRSSCQATPSSAHAAIARCGRAPRRRSPDGPRPARAATSSALSCSRRSTPAPTVPRPGDPDA